MADANQTKYVSRGGEKLAAALDAVQIDVRAMTCADLGSHVGGFVDCLLRRGASRVYSVDTCYGILAWKLRRDPRVVVVERTNAMHVRLPESVDLVTIDVGWTKQEKVLPSVRAMLTPTGRVITLIKPQYEARKDELRGGVVDADCLAAVVERVLDRIRDNGWKVRATARSPILGHGGNAEHFALLERASEGS